MTLNLLRINYLFCYVQMAAIATSQKDFIPFPSVGGYTSLANKIPKDTDNRL